MKDKKQYRLKRGYPSLKKTVEVGCIITKIYTCGGYHYRGSDNEGVIFYVSGSQCENNPDFWELIEDEEPKPLFVTEDGVEISDLCQTVYLIHPKTFIRQKSNLGYFSANDLDNNKLFFHESNADEYVVWHKKWFSVNDLLLADIGITTNQLDKLHQMAIKKNIING